MFMVFIPPVGNQAEGDNNDAFPWLLLGVYPTLDTADKALETWHEEHPDQLCGVHHGGAAHIINFTSVARTPY